MKTLLLGVVLLFVFGALPAGARNLSSTDGNTLLSKCHAAERMWAKAQSLVFYCVPNGASWPQHIRVLVKWLEENPDKLSLSGYDVISLSMSKAYPCAATGH
jgi:hypothetical protein